MMLRALLSSLWLALAAPLALAQTTAPFSALGNQISITATSGASSASTALPGTGGSSVQVVNTGSVPVTIAFSTTSGGASAALTNTAVNGGATAYLSITPSVVDTAIYGVGGTPTVYVQRGGGGSGSSSGGGGGGGNPGGVNGQLQYNNSGSFGGLSTPLPLNGYASASLPTCNGAAKGQVAYTTDNTAALVFCTGSSWVGSGGTAFTITPTGCTPSATAGSATAGSITLASGPCTSIVVTFNGSVGMTASNGWHCNVGDKTTQNAGTWVPEWGESASNTTTATIPVPGAAGATDVLTFACTPY